jgi:5-methyltetrahydropteroyltriglutamate--homocysteine methyltransferase
MQAHAAGKISADTLRVVQDLAVNDTIHRLEETGSPIVTDGEQSKPSFATYPLVGLERAPDGVTIPFADGHRRQLPQLTRGPFRYGVQASTYLKAAQRYARRPVKQAVISASALSLLYPQSGIEGYPREKFLADLVSAAEKDIRECMQANAACVQIDFTEGRLALKLDSSGGLLRTFVELNNRVLSAFSDTERRKIGVHTCPGGDQDSTHSADVDYTGLLPVLFQLKVGPFYTQLASEADRKHVSPTIRGLLTCITFFAAQIRVHIGKIGSETWEQLFVNLGRKHRISRGRSHAQLHHRRASTSLVLRRFGDGDDVRVLLQILA